MKRASLFLIILIIASGCHAGNPSEQKTVKTSSSTVNTEINNPLGYTLNIFQSAEKLQFRFKVKNQSKHKMTLQFNTSQTYDYMIKNAQGKVVSQYSKGRMFAQHVSFAKLEPEQELGYQGDLPNLKKGQYHITFWLTASGVHQKISQTFIVK